MNRGELKSRDNERKQIADFGSQRTVIFIEAEKTTVSKLFNGEPYDMADMKKSAELLLSRNGFDSKTQLQVFENVEEFNEKLTKSQKPVFFIYAKSKNCWVLFCSLSNQNGKKIFYKDSSGYDIGQGLEDCLRRKIVGVDIITNKHKGHRVDEDYNYGPLCLRNLKIYLDGMKNNQQKFVSEFSQKKFCETANLNDDKLWNVVKVINEIAENKPFTKALKEFVDRIPSMDFMDDYNKVLEEESKKDEINYDRLEKARKECFNKGNLKKINDSFQVKEDEFDYELDIEKKFPSEFGRLQKILLLLNKTEVNEKLHKALDSICETLHIDADKMKQFYKPKNKDEAQKEDKLTPKNIIDIIKNLQEIKPSSDDPSSNDTPFDQLMKEIRLGIDPENSETPQTSNQQQDKETIEEKYYLVKSKYAQWKSKSLDEINKWAIQTKGHLTSSEDDICEAIAVMNRAFNLLTGCFLRDTQILAALIFLHNQEKQGRLCQIQTGEGKTNIVSLLAVVKALQGFKVDVITSNPLLAEDGVKETETFYSVFNLTVSTNNPSQNGEAKIGYLADILYGTISNFQFDYLRDSFEGYNIRRERPFGQVILDEVDSMLVDNGGHIAKLASPFPGMECLRYIYIKIWQALLKAEEEFVSKNKAELEQFLKNSHSDEEYETFIQNMADRERGLLKEKIKAANPTNVPFVPLYLKEYVSCKLDTWIKNALHAKYNCHEHQQYRIIQNDAGEQVITPVDYLNTGVTMKNTIWSNGLHQFVQLKHNLYLTFESLTSSFISNIGYIKNYDGKNIFGLTGTLGSRAEQELLADIYNVSYAKLPTYRKKKFEEIEDVVVDDDSWSIQTTIEILKKIDDKRAVLAIFETEQDLLMIQDNLKLLQNEEFNVRMFANEDNAEETKENVKIGDIILATNIAGRGTNFRTEPSLEENGGLHVLVGFLPCNKRVEDQAFGRTSRQGNSGTAQLVIKQSEVDELEIEGDANFTQIKEARDKLERRRLDDIRNILVVELNFKDELFKRFSKFYREWKEGKNRKEDEFLINDLKEFWAFWLEKKNYNIKNITNAKVEDEFKSFSEQATTITNGEINHNPFYSIQLANIYIEDENTADAKKALKHAIKIAGNKDELLGGANLKLFEVAVLEGEQFKKRFQKALKDIFRIHINDTEQYKKEAVEYLRKARNSIEIELNYFTTHFLTKVKEETEISEELRKILVTEDNSFWKHIFSRYQCLTIHQTTIDGLLQQFEKKSVRFDIGGKVPAMVENLQEANPELCKTLTNWELNELQSIGIEAFYCLKEVPDVPKVVIDAARGEIITGIALLVAGLAFPPIFPLMSGPASDLISGAIIDLVTAVIIPEEVDSHDYMKGKFISYGKSLVTLGVSAALQSVRILQKAINFCRKLSKFLQETTKFKKACDVLVKLVDKLQDYLEKLLLVAKINKLGKADKLEKMNELQSMGKLDEFNKLGGVEELKNLEDLKKAGKLTQGRAAHSVDFMKNVTIKTSKSIASTIVNTKIIQPLVEQAWQNATSTIFEKIQESLRNSIKEREPLLQKLKTTKREDIDAVVKDFIEMNFLERKFVQFAPKLLDLLKKMLKLTDSKTAILKIGLVAGVDFSELIRYGKKFSSELDEKLTGGDCANNVEEVVNEICVEVASQMLDVVKKILGEGKDIGAVVVNDKIHSGDAKNFYSILGLKAEASVEEVKEKFREQVLKLPLDKSLRAKRFDELKMAYQGIVGQTLM